MPPNQRPLRHTEPPTTPRHGKQQKHDMAHYGTYRLRDGCATALADVNLLEFQMLKSEPSIDPSALKSPLHQAAVPENLLAFQTLKSEPSTTPSRLASPGK